MQMLTEKEIKKRGLEIASQVKLICNKELLQEVINNLQNELDRFSQG